jgi:hypothetical protein
MGLLFCLPGVRTKTCPLFDFSVEATGAPALEADRRRAAQSCGSGSSGAAMGLPFSPSWVRTKTCPLFDFSMARR